MPSGGDGFYYFSTHLVVMEDEYAYLDIQINGERICTAYTDQQDSPGDDGQAACSAVTYSVQGFEPDIN